VNREAEQETPSRVACSDLLDGFFIWQYLLDTTVGVVNLTHK